MDVRPLSTDQLVEGDDGAGLAFQSAICIFNNGDTAATTGDNNGVIEQFLNLTNLNNLLGNGGGDNAAVATACIFLHGVTLGCSQFIGLFLGIECANRLGGLLECGSAASTIT